MEENILPIKQYKRQILYAVDHNDITIITAETGSGKTTQIPQFLIQAGYIVNDKLIGIVLPRRIAAMSLAKRVSQQLGCYNGQIAYHVRFQSTVNQNTRVIYLTDGMLVQQLYSDPLLNKYSIIILDDIHQRSINFQILFGFLKKLLLKDNKNNLKLIITSATLQSIKIRQFFQKIINYKDQNQKKLKIKQLNITGRLYDVNINYLQYDTKNYFLKIFQTIIYIDRQKGQGDILIFLPSVQQIQGMLNMLDSYSIQNKRKLKVIPLHSGLSLDQQSKIFQHSFQRKIIVSTNISQSSITIPGIKYVIDSGYVKIKIYDSQKQVEKMIVVPCGKSCANQRAGRAGRIMNGQCYRIYTQNGYLRMLQRVTPQILRIHLANFILKLKGLGITDIINFQMLQKPNQYNLIKAIDTLYAYSIINQDFNLTQKGKKASQFSLDIRLASMLLDSFDSKFGCSKEILMLVSMLEIQRQLFTGQGLGVLKTKKKIGAKQGDFLTLINIFLRYTLSKPNDKKRICSEYRISYNAMQRATKIHHQLIDQIKSFNRYKNIQEQMQSKYGQKQKQILQIKSSSDDYQPILRAILMGYFTNIAQLQGDGTYLNIRSKQKLKIHPTSILSTIYPQWIIYLEIVKSSDYYIYNGSKIQPQWIFQLAGHYYQDLRKDQLTNQYNKQKQIQRFDSLLVRQQQNLVKIGKIIKKPQIFKTDVLKLKNMKKNKLSFQQDL